ncbi:MAG: aspartate--ammonia ligase [Lachnospiraceae bacterium]|nr:aspartate--ammonia ligase [Lachnospiraceae bacterium]
MSRLTIPDAYRNMLDVKETQHAIKYIKDHFERQLGKQLNLTRVSAPLFVRPESGLNDNLNGVERPVSFDIKDLDDANVEVVHSLAKWKRMALKLYGFGYGEGLYTDMTAIRRDEELDNLHSVYVDQWDWEKVILKDERTVDTLKAVVRRIFQALKDTEHYICDKYPFIGEILPEEIAFVTTQELENMWPDDTPKERENKICRMKKAVFLMQIGDKMASGERHDGRAPDYDDWALNGDILVYYPVLDSAFELSSMGIRVDEDSLASQLKKAGCEERAELPFQKAILNRELPYTIGGGIGQSRMCMYFLRKAHIGEVHSSVWPAEMIEEAGKAGIRLL